MEVRDAHIDAAHDQTMRQARHRRGRPPSRQTRGITAPARLTLDSLRHGFALLLIANGPNVVFVSRQLGHANPTITLTTYAHLLERADHAQAAREALEASYAAMAGRAGETPRPGNGGGNSPLIAFQ